ncbi:MAG: exodeoxyribonuclease VII small subunit [Pseudobdellovibrionaceae bacterium]
MEFEKKISRLEEIVLKMEKGQLGLDQSLKLFEEGVKLSRECHQKINEAEMQVKLLLSVDENGQPMTKDFRPENKSGENA